MQNIALVQNLQALDHLDEDSPNIVFFHVCLLFLVPHYALVEVTIVCELHHNTRQKIRRAKWCDVVVECLPKRLGGLVDKCLIIGTDVFVLDACEDANFVQSVLLLFRRQLLHLYFLQCVNLIVCKSPHLVDATVCSFAYQSCEYDHKDF